MVSYLLASAEDTFSLGVAYMSKTNIEIFFRDFGEDEISWLFHY